MTRVMVIGIDAMDADLLARFAAELPNLSRLKSQNPRLSLTSTYPPDTPTAWASAYTGLNPAQHGIVYFVDPLDKVSILASMDLSSDSIRGKTFWDIAGSQGKRVCILLPFLGYPVWPVNGIMVGRSTNRYNKGPLVDCWPHSLAEEEDFSGLRPIFSIPHRKHYPSYIDAYRKLLKAEMEFGLKMIRRERWDIFFLYSSALDWLGHNLWSYLDETDPAYPGKNKYQGILLEFYKLYDSMVGELMEASGKDATTIVFSDHGFAQRPSRLLNVNELLRREGLLVPRAGSNMRGVFNPVEIAKKMAVSFVNRYGAGAWTMWLVHHLPGLRRQFTVPQTIDWDRTCAYVSDLSGIKAYSYGGIIIAADKLKGRSYEDTRTRLIEMLSAFKEPESGQQLVEWARRREDLYAGPYLKKYPDIVLQLRRDYGVGWSVGGELVTSSPTHNIQPGTHRADSAALLVSDSGGATVIRKDLCLMDIAPTVLGLQGITPTFAMDGLNFLPVGNTG